MLRVLVNAPSVYNAPYARLRIDNTFPSDDRPRAKHRIAAHLGVVPDDGAELPKLRAEHGVGVAVLYCDRRFVAFDIGSDRAGAQMGFIAKHRISDIIVMRHLHTVEQKTVLKLRGVADYRVFPTITLPRIKAQCRTSAPSSMMHGPAMYAVS